MFDAWGKIPSGIFYGNSFERGNFDQCLLTSHDSDNETVGTIKGQYCTASMNLEEMMPLPAIQAAGMVGGASLSR